jgi:hypothetical protein
VGPAQRGVFLPSEASRCSTPVRLAVKIARGLNATDTTAAHFVVHRAKSVSVGDPAAAGNPRPPSVRRSGARCLHRARVAVCARRRGGRWESAAAIPAALERALADRPNGSRDRGPTLTGSRAAAVLPSMRSSRAGAVRRARSGLIEEPAFYPPMARPPVRIRAPVTGLGRKSSCGITWSRLRSEPERHRVRGFFCQPTNVKGADPCLPNAPPRFAADWWPR